MPLHIICFRHSFEYLDREDMIIAHVAGEIDAFIKLPHGWPISDLALELISLKSTSQYSKEISLSFLCKIVVCSVHANYTLISGDYMFIMKPPHLLCP